MHAFQSRVAVAMLASLLLAAVVDGHAREAQQWSANVIGIEEMHLSAEYWIENTNNADELLLTAEEVYALNRHAFAEDPNMVDLSALPERISQTDALALIRSISKPSSSPLYFSNGTAISASDYAVYDDALNLQALPEMIAPQYGLVVERADMRTWPSDDMAFKSQDPDDLDRFQENGLFPADVVAVLHESADKRWYFTQSYNYAAWVKKEKIALGPRETIFEYASREPFLLISGSKVSTNFNPHEPATSELQLDMGIRLPLLQPHEVSHNVDGQNPYASHIVELPLRSESGELGFRPALVARSQDVRKGYLPYTRTNIVRQAFKFLGERYGWGHSYNARDCSGLVAEIYKTFGILLPRNSGQQGRSPVGRSTHLNTTHSEQEKLQAVLAADTGDLLFAPGHVMMYLGVSNEQPYVIHDLSGSGWIDKNGERNDGVLNGVSVTPLLPVLNSPQFTYFEQLYAIKQIR